MQNVSLQNCGNLGQTVLVGVEIMELHSVWQCSSLEVYGGVWHGEHPFTINPGRKILLEDIGLPSYFDPQSRAIS